MLGGTRLWALVGRRYRHGASEDSDNTAKTWDTCRRMLLLLAVANYSTATASWANSSSGEALQQHHRRAAICLFHLQVEFELLARREQLRIATTTLTILPCFSDELD